MDLAEIVKGLIVLTRGISKGIEEGKRKRLERRPECSEKEDALTTEETQLFNELYEGGPCVICGAKGVHMLDVYLRKDAGCESSRTLYRKSYVRRDVVAPLCTWHHFWKIKVPDLIREVVLTISLIIIFLGSVFFSLSIGDDALTVIIWFIVCFIVGYFGLVILLAILGLILNLNWDEAKTFKKVSKRGLLARLCELHWSGSAYSQKKKKK